MTDASAGNFIYKRLKTLERTVEELQEHLGARLPPGERISFAVWGLPGLLWFEGGAEKPKTVREEQDDA